MLGAYEVRWYIWLLRGNLGQGFELPRESNWRT